MVSRVRSLLVSVLTYEVTGISPQSRILNSLWKGLASRGTLYPPLNPNLREPFGQINKPLQNVLEIETARTLSDAAGTKAGAWSVRSAGVEGGADKRNVIFLLIAGKTWKVRKPSKCGDAREDRVRLREVSQRSINCVAPFCR